MEHRVPGISVGDLAECCLRRNSYLALSRLSCEFCAGCLVLRGCVSTYYLRQLAEEAVTGVLGVQSIDNRIEVIA